MSLHEIEIILLWFSTGLYVIATTLALSGALWTNAKLQEFGYWICAVAATSHGTGLLLRWYLAGRAPYQDTYEKLSSHAWWVLVMYLILVRMWPFMKQAGVLVYPATLLLTGWATLQSKDITQVPATYQTFWLSVHVVFAKMSYGSALFATGTSVMYLMKTRFLKVKESWLLKMPEPAQLDYYSYRLTAFAFVMMGVMIASGAIWAHQAWGRYWFWDPIETWSLISWLCYGLYLHLRFTGGKPKHAALFNVFALFLLIITFFGLPYMYDSIHRS